MTNFQDTDYLKLSYKPEYNDKFDEDNFTYYHVAEPRILKFLTDALLRDKTANILFLQKFSDVAVDLSKGVDNDYSVYKHLPVSVWCRFDRYNPSCNKLEVYRTRITRIKIVKGEDIGIHHNYSNYFIGFVLSREEAILQRHATHFIGFGEGPYKFINNKWTVKAEE